MSKPAVPLLRIIFFLTTFYIFRVYASPQLALEVVVVEGVGMTPEEARENALVQAVSRVVGLMVDADTRVENEEVVKDQVLTHSRGFVKTFSELGEPLKQEDGTYHLRITATVARTELLERLRKAKVQTNEVDGEGLFAESFTRNQMTERGLRLLEEVFKGLPENLLVAKVSEREIVKTGDPTTVRLTIIFGHNQKAYFEKVVPSMQQALGQTAQKKLPTVLKEKGAPHATVLGNHKLIGRAPYNPPKLSESESSLRLLTNRNQNGDQLQWEVYVFDDKRYGDFFRRKTNQHPKLRIEFVDENNQVILEEDIHIQALFSSGHLTNPRSYSKWHFEKQGLAYTKDKYTIFAKSLGEGFPEIQIHNIPSFIHEYQNGDGSRFEIPEGTFGIAPFVVFRCATDRPGRTYSREYDFLAGLEWYQNFYSTVVRFDWDFEIPLDELKNIHQIKTYWVPVIPKPLDHQ